MGVGARPSGWTWTGACALLLVALALVAAGTDGARTGTRGGAPGHYGGMALAGAARRSLLSQPRGVVLHPRSQHGGQLVLPTAADDPIAIRSPCSIRFIECQYQLLYLA